MFELTEPANKNPFGLSQLQGSLYAAEKNLPVSFDIKQRSPLDTFYLGQPQIFGILTWLEPCAECREQADLAPQQLRLRRDSKPPLNFQLTMLKTVLRELGNKRN